MPVELPLLFFRALAADEILLALFAALRSSTCHFGAARGALSRLSNLSERPEQGVRDGRPTNARGCSFGQAYAEPACVASGAPAAETDTTHASVQGGPRLDLLHLQSNLPR
ncbi:hypothetical protein L1887_55612 [Cichorium endivia]|nr:hypothetical protein L1887_55612 [Cichorium endivia]